MRTRVRKSKILHAILLITYVSPVTIKVATDITTTVRLSIRICAFNPSPHLHFGFQLPQGKKLFGHAKSYRSQQLTQ
jgi:hypothetical protein